jgi:aryl-alcohol dehydrogenase-like predicted oxidoreductase
VLGRGDDNVPIHGTKRVPYLEENVAALDVELSAEDLARIEESCPRTSLRASATQTCRR